MKSIARQVAEHLGADIQDVRDHEYQPGFWNQQVYCGSGNRYWSAGSRSPKNRHENSDIVWRLTPSNYPGNPDLWVGE